MYIFYYCIVFLFGGCLSGLHVLIITNLLYLSFTKSPLFETHYAISATKVSKQKNESIIQYRTENNALTL